MCVFSKYRKGCQVWEKEKRTREYENWKIDHVRQAKHDKSSGAMEAAGAIQIFTQSVEKNNLIYRDYVGD